MTKTGPFVDDETKYKRGYTNGAKDARFGIGDYSDVLMPGPYRDGYSDGYKGVDSRH